MRAVLLGLPVRCLLVGLSVYLISRVRRGWQPPTAVLIAVTLASLPFWGQLAKRSVDTAREVPMWDMQMFATYFEAVRWGQDPYDPVQMAEAARRIGADPTQVELEEQVIRVGVAYPPFSLPLFGVIGHLPREVRPYAWHALIGGALLLTVWVIARKIGGSGGALASSFLLVGAWPGSLSAVGFSQIIIAIGPLLMLAAMAKQDARRGAFTALACVIKPIGCFGLLIPVLGRKWRAFAFSLGLLAAMFVLGALGVGREAVADYFFDGPHHHAPIRRFTEGMNQSLVGVLMRNGAASLPHPGSPAIAASWSLVIVGVAATFYRGRNYLTDVERLNILMPAALLLYVGTLQTYSLLLVPSLLLVTRLPSATGTALFAVAICGLVGLSGESYGFAASVSTLLVVCFSALREHRDVPFDALIAPAPKSSTGSPR